MDWVDLIFILLAALLTIVAATLWQQRACNCSSGTWMACWCSTLLERWYCACSSIAATWHRRCWPAIPGFRTGLAGKRREVEVLLLALQALPADSDASIRRVAEHELPGLKLRWDQDYCRELDGLTACNSMMTPQRDHRHAAGLAARVSVSLA